MGSDQEKIEEEKRRRAQEERLKAEAESRAEELRKQQREVEIILERERIKREEEERERRIRERNENEINTFRNTQNIAYFLELIQKFQNYSFYLKKTLEALDEDRVIKNYKDFKNESQGKILLIKEAINEKNNKLSLNCQRKLIIILLCNQKSIGNCDSIFDYLVNISPYKKELLFNILLDYSNIFGEDIHFKDIKIYNEFIEFSLENGNKYVESLNYRSNDIIQLELLYEKRDKIFDSGNIVKFTKLNDYSRAYELIKKIIEYEKKKGKKFVLFLKDFWNKYSIHYKNFEKDDSKIQKLFELYKLLLSYIDLGKDDSEYKDILAADIHKLIQIKLESETNIVKDQLELLFTTDPYYVYPCDKRNPNIFQNINICNLKEAEDIEYFKNLNKEKVYTNEFTSFLDVIINQINTIEDLNSIIKIIELKEEKNRKEYINLLIKRYSEFNEEELTEESFINLLKKVREYIPEEQLNLLEEFLPKFKQKYTIYLKILETFEEDDDIKEQIAILSNENLELSNIIELIKKLSEDQKKNYFNNLNQFIIKNDDFFELESSDNLLLLMELMKNKLIPESIYLDKTKDLLNTIYEKLTTYNEKKVKYLDTIINEKDENQKIYTQRFELFKLIKDDKFDSKSEFNKIKNQYLQAKNEIEKAYDISNLLSFYYKNSYKEEMDKINNIYKDYSNQENEVKKWYNKENEIIDFIGKYEEKANLIKEVKEIQLFQIIYNEFCEGDEIPKFDKAIELFDGCNVIFDDIQKGNPEILDKWQNKFKKGGGIEELTKLKKYYNKRNKENSDKVEKNEKFEKVAKNSFNSSKSSSSISLTLISLFSSIFFCFISNFFISSSLFICFSSINSSFSSILIFSNISFFSFS